MTGALGGTVRKRRPPYVARRYRVASHVGKVRQRLAKAITQAFSNQQVQIRCEPNRLWPAAGYWKHNRQDVMRWEGQIDVLNDFGRWQTLGIGSWDRMTECLKGFTIWRDGGSYEVGAIEPGNKGSERYTLEA